MSDHILAPVPLTPMKGHPLPTEREARWIPQSQSVGFTIEKTLVPAGKRTQITRSFTVYPSQYTDRAVPTPTKRYKFPKITPWLRSSRVVYMLPGDANSLSVSSVYWLRRIWGTAFKREVQSLHLIWQRCRDACVKVGDTDSEWSVTPSR
jgi:hypothetical protein